MDVEREVSRVVLLLQNKNDALDAVLILAVPESMEGHEPVLDRGDILADEQGFEEWSGAANELAEEVCAKWE